MGWNVLVVAGTKLGPVDGWKGVVAGFGGWKAGVKEGCWKGMLLVVVGLKVVNLVVAVAGCLEGLEVMVVRFVEADA